MEKQSITCCAVCSKLTPTPSPSICSEVYCIRYARDHIRHTRTHEGVPGGHPNRSLRSWAGKADCVRLELSVPWVRLERQLMLSPLLPLKLVICLGQLRVCVPTRGEAASGARAPLWAQPGRSASPRPCVRVAPGSLSACIFLCHSHQRFLGVCVPYDGLLGCVTRGLKGATERPAGKSNSEPKEHKPGRNSTCWGVCARGVMVVWVCVCASVWLRGAVALVARF